MYMTYIIYQINIEMGSSFLKFVESSWTGKHWHFSRSMRAENNLSLFEIDCKKNKKSFCQLFNINLLGHATDADKKEFQIWFATKTDKCITIPKKVLIQKISIEQRTLQSAHTHTNTHRCHNPIIMKKTSEEPLQHQSSVQNDRFQKHD